MFLLPPSITRAPSCSEYGGPGMHRRDRVYLATTLEAALLFASLHRSGKATQAEPTGDVEPDPDWHGEPGASIQVPKARIVRVFRVYPSVREQVRAQVIRTMEAA